MWGLIQLILGLEKNDIRFIKNEVLVKVLVQGV